MDKIISKDKTIESILNANILNDNKNELTKLISIIDSQDVALDINKIIFDLKKRYNHAIDMAKENMRFDNNTMYVGWNNRADELLCIINILNSYIVKGELCRKE